MLVAGPRTRVTDAGDGMVMPGIIEVHSHDGFGGQAAAWELRLPPTFGPYELRANVSMWNEIEQGRPVPWTQTMAASARAWAEHRTGPRDRMTRGAGAHSASGLRIVLDLPGGFLTERSV